MEGNDMWEYLDKLDKNLLYDYAKFLSGEKQSLKFHCRIEEKDNKQEGTRRVHRYQSDNEDEQFKRQKEERDKVFYIIWFVYRYILNCKTLEEALQIPVEEVFKKYRLETLIRNRYCLYIGIDRDVMVYKESDMCIILEILYKRLGFWEQLDCFITHTKGCRRTRCIEVKEKYEELLAKGR